MYKVVHDTKACPVQLEIDVFTLYLSLFITFIFYPDKFPTLNVM